jgi:hypothetical protein
MYGWGRSDWSGISDEDYMEGENMKGKNSSHDLDLLCCDTMQ